MKKKFILPILTLLVILGFVIHSYATMTSVFLFVEECIFCVIAIPFVIYTASMNCINEESNMERHTFLSITMTLFVKLAMIAAILFVCVGFYSLEKGGPAHLGLIGSVIVAGITSLYIVCVSVYYIYHIGTILPKNQVTYDDYSDYEFDF